MSDFINRASDTELSAAAQQFLSALSDNPATYGATADDVTELETQLADFDGKLHMKTALQAQAISANKNKDLSRDLLEKILRKRSKKAKDHDSITESNLALLGQIMTSVYVSLSNPTRPVGKVDTSERLRHTISFADEATPDQKRKPAGTIGCQIWKKVGGAPPTDEKECSFVALDTATPTF